MFSTRVGFYTGPADIAKNWYDYSNTEIYNEISTWNKTSNLVFTTYNLGTTVWNGSDVYRGAVTHPNGNIYMAPCVTTKTTIMEFDPVNLVTREISTGISMSGAARYVVGGLSYSGKIWWAPYNMNKILIYDPASNVSQVQDYGLTLSGYIAAATYDDKLYCVGSPAHCLIIDMAANTATQSTLGGVINSATANKWVAGVRSIKDKNKMYFAPYANTTTLIVDGTSNTATSQTWGFSFGTNASQGIGNGKTGNLYMTSHQSTSIYAIDPISNVTTRISTAGIRGIRSVMGNDGNVIIAPSPAAGSGVHQFIDVTTNTVASLNPTITARMGSAMSLNGNVYIFPQTNGNTHVVIYNFGGTGNTSSMTANVALSTYFNMDS